MTTPSSLEELREGIIKLIDDGPINVLHLGTCLCIQHEDIPELPDTCSCGAENNVVETIRNLFRSHMEAAIEEIVEGPKNQSVWYNTQKQNFADGYSEAMKNVRERAKSYLEGEKQ